MNKKINILNEEISYFEENNHHKKVLFLHGFSSSLNIISPLLKNKNRNYDIIAFDFPGCGESTFNEKITFERYTEIAKKFIEIKKYNNLIVVGHSLGGAIATTIANKKQISNIILLAPLNPFQYEFALTKFETLITSIKMVYHDLTTFPIIINKMIDSYDIKKLPKKTKTLLELIKNTKPRFMNLLFNQIISPQYQNTIIYNFFKNANKEKIIILQGNNDFFVPKESIVKTTNCFKLKAEYFENIGHSMIEDATIEVNNKINNIK